jgi:hypothetical protein
LAAGGPQPLLLRKAAAYVTRILSVFGLLPVGLVKAALSVRLISSSYQLLAGRTCLFFCW